MVMIRLCSPKIVQEIADRLKFSPTHQRIILNDRIKAEQRLEILEANPPKSNSRLHSILKTFRTELIHYMMACAKKDETRKALSLFYTKLRDIKVLIRGEHLITLGVRPGPEFKRIMSSVLKARLDHQVATLENEIDFAKGYIRQNKIVD
jgi:tRNA nucleotidyltransferase (CCA-adding enzyme)